MTFKSIQIQIASEAELINTGKPTQRHLEIIITAPAVQKKKERTPLNLALVLDRSGSMGGNKLTNAKLAAEYIVNKLEESDLVSLVAFDDQVMTISPAVNLSETNRNNLKHGIRHLHTGGSTNLGDGWLRGCQLIGEAQQDHFLNRCLLLTDGQANQGMVDMEELGYHAAQINQRGVSTSTFGIGEDYDERLLENMANQGGGRYYYIETANDIPLVMAKELEGLSAVTVRESVLTLTFPANIDFQLLGDAKHKDSPGVMEIKIGDLVANNETSLYFSVMTPPKNADDSIKIQAQITGIGEDDQPIQSLEEYTYRYASEEEVNQVVMNQNLIRRYIKVEMGVESEKALKLEKAGLREQGSHHLHQYLRNASPSLTQADRNVLYQMADDVKTGLSPMDQKRLHRDMYNHRHNQNEMTEEEKEEMRKRMLESK